MLDQLDRYPPSDLPDWESLPEESIELSPEQFDRAAQISQPLPNGRRRWQAYLHALALFGFEQWLEEWAPDLAVNDSRCSVLHPPYATLIEAVCNLQVESFCLCLIARGSLSDPWVNLPKATTALPQFVPHIYVLVDVLEEQMQAIVYGYLQHHELVERQQLTPLSTASEWAYALPVDWFTPAPESLLLELRCLEPGTDSLPIVQDAISRADLQAKLAARLAQPQSLDPLPEQGLTWEDGMVLLKHPELVAWFYRELSAANQPALATAPPTQLPQPTINVGLWLQDRLDAIAQSLAWVLMPPFASATPAFRTVVEDLETVLSALETRGVAIPHEARGAYRDVPLDGTVLRLYAVTWALPTLSEDPEWTLLVALGTQASDRIPAGVRLQVRDKTQLLMERVSTGDFQDSYMCIQVAGTWDEQFWVAIEMNNGVIITPPPFVFHPAGAHGISLSIPPEGSED